MWMRTARRVAVAWLRGFEWMRMVLEVDGEARCCRLVGWGLRGCGGVGVDGEAFLLLLG